ncbi:Dbl homology domain-containing protein [Sporodiniella umbellata]|nr:Dbl homology domain-containing protein [Sporodiniella umbellata]
MTRDHPFFTTHSISSLVLGDAARQGYEFTVPNPELEFGIIDSLDYDDFDDGLYNQEILYQRREGLIKELYQTEKDYVKNVLEILQTAYLSPLRKNAKQTSFGFLGIKKQPCTERELSWLFGNIESLLELHHSILTSLEERLSIWGPTQIMSDVIHAWFPNIQKAYHAYLEHYSLSVSTFEKLSRYQPFKKFLESVEKNVDVRLLDLLKAPKACVLRYAKILTSLSDNTPMMHPDYSGLICCKNRAGQLFDEFLPSISNAKNVDQVYEVHCSMTDLPFGITAERRLYLQGEFTQIIKSGTSEEKAYILFSDMLVFAKRKKSCLQFKGHVQLEQAHVRALSKQEASGEEYCIEILSSFQTVDSLNATFVASPTAHIIKTHDRHEQDQWVQSLEKAITKLSKKTDQKLALSHSGKSTTSISVRRPGTTLSSGSSQSAVS